MMLDKSLAPIVLFVYNRPRHTLQTLKSLQQNRLAGQSELFIFADGPRENASAQDREQIRAVRALLRQEQWCGKVRITESPVNKGLRDSILDGVSRVVNVYGSVIVLEDDLVTSAGFLTYMNDALSFYRDQEKVMHVSAYLPPVKAKLPETFFFNNTTCHGWATWARAWRHLNLDVDYLMAEIRKPANFDRFNKDGVKDFFVQLEDNKSGRGRTWAIFWQASVFLQDGLCLHPRASLVRNTGYDGSGVHCGSTDAYHIEQLAGYIKVEKIDLAESPRALRAVKDFYISLSPHWYGRLLVHVHSRLPQPVKSVYQTCKRKLLPR